MKIVITGPESSGKSTLFKALEKHYEISGAREYARDFLSKSNGNYQCKDLKEIAKGQLILEFNSKNQNAHFLLCDTDLVTIKIWSEYKFNFCDNLILNLLNDHPADLYLLMSPDIPWEPDPLRENPNDRMSILDLYIKNIEDLEIPYSLISGSVDQRFIQAIKLIDKMLSTN